MVSKHAFGCAGPGSCSCGPCQSAAVGAAVPLPVPDDVARMAWDITGAFLPSAATRVGDTIVSRVLNPQGQGQGQKVTRDPAVDLVYSQVSMAVQRLGTEVEQNARVDASTRAAAAALRREWQSVTEDWQAGELDMSEITAFSSRVSDLLARAATAPRPRMSFPSRRRGLLLAAGAGMVVAGGVGVLVAKVLK